jgi:hypothetical protein
LGPLAVKIDAVQSHSGVIFENCQFMSGFEIGPLNSGPVKLNNCGFWGRPGSGSQIDLLGPCTLTCTATHFHKWDYDNLGRACVTVTNGSLLMTQCDFMKDGHPRRRSFSARRPFGGDHQQPFSTRQNQSHQPIARRSHAG